MSHPAGTSIAIIGGGASAALLLAAMASREATDIAVDVYDRSGRFARGIAYATPHDHHLLNVRAANMSGLAADREHFARWAYKKAGYNAHDFVPRRTYGDYLEKLFNNAREIFPIRAITEDVTSSRHGRDGFTVNDRNYTQVILATGNVMPMGPRTDGAVKGYLPDPWALSKGDIQSAQSVALIGTGLTAVDAVLTLESLGYKGTITMISRRTLLPGTHTDPASWPNPPLSADDADKPLSHLLAMIRLHVREAAAQNIPWQAVIDSLRPTTNPLWRNFSPAQKARFSKHLLTLWNIHRHRMAPQIAAQLDALREQGRLKMLRESVKRIAPGPMVEGVKGHHPFDGVINCMGYRYTEEGRGYDYSHAIGPALFDEGWFETTAIPEIRMQADEIAAALLS